MIVKNSTRKNKRFMAEFTKGKPIHFGQKGGSTFIDHRDKIKRKNYIKRHEVNEKRFYSSPYHAATLSRFILWGQEDSLDKAVKAFNIKFKNP
tara:strand:+ start:154 stop:432 length:279 start_codon:yes stop_codon:yes gene_type:complete